MNIYLTEYYKTVDGEKVLWAGPEIRAESIEDVKDMIKDSYRVVGTLVRRIPPEMCTCRDFQPGKA